MNFEITPAVKILLIINVVAFIVSSLTGYTGFDIQAIFSMYDTHSTHFQIYQYLTSIFLHVDLMHIFFNMFALVMFGKFLEKSIGSKRLMILFLVSGIGANMLSSAVSYYQNEKMLARADLFIEEPTSSHLSDFLLKENFQSQNLDHLLVLLDAKDKKVIKSLKKEVVKVVTRKLDTRSLGASGATFGIMLAFALLFPNLELMLIFPPIPIKAKYMVIIYGLYEMYRMFQNNPNDNVAHLVHLSGMLFAYVMIKLVWKVPRVY